MAEPHSDTGNVNEAKKAACGFVVTCREPASVLQLVEAAFDHVAQGVDAHVHGLSDLAVLAHRDHRDGIAFLDIFPDLGNHPISTACLGVGLTG